MSTNTARAPDDPITEDVFRKIYGYEDFGRLSRCKKFLRSFRCTRQTLVNAFPILKWLPQYNLRKNLMSDIIAGVTVAIMHIPHGLSYAPLGRTEPVVGLYMAIFPVFVYIIMGTSRQISIGTFAVVCAMVGEIVNDNQNASSPIADGGNKTTEKQYSALEIGTAVCLLTGLWQTLLGLLKLGILLVVMSNSLISGFTTAAACYVFSYQLKHLFGVNVASFKGLAKLFHLYIDFFSKIKTTNLITISISLTAITILLIFNELIKPLISKKYPKNRIPVPIELAVIVAGILISYFLDLADKYNVKTVQHIPEGIPQPKAPPIVLLPSLIFPSLVVALVALATNLSLAKIFAKKANYEVSDNQELMAYGTANIFAAYFLCLPSAASLSRSSIQYSTGGKTQLASLFSIVVIVLVVLFAGPLFEPVPYCILSSVVVVTLKGLLMQFADLPKIWRASVWDGIVWLGTFLAVVILDIGIGLGFGIALSLLTMTCSSLVFQVNVLGQVPETKVFLDLRRYRRAVSLPKILILEIVGNLNYGNCNKLEEKILMEFAKFSANSIEDDSFVVIDVASVVKMDPSTVETFKHLYKYLLRSNSKMYLTHCNATVYATLELCGFFNECPRNQVFARIEDAVAYLTKPT